MTVTPSATQATEQASSVNNVASLQSFMTRSLSSKADFSRGSKSVQHKPSVAVYSKEKTVREDEDDLSTCGKSTYSDSAA